MANRVTFTGIEVIYYDTAAKARVTFTGLEYIYTETLSKNRVTFTGLEYIYTETLSKNRVTFTGVEVIYSIFPFPATPKPFVAHRMARAEEDDQFFRAARRAFAPVITINQDDGYTYVVF